MNIAIMRTFVASRKEAFSYKEIMQILTDMQRQYDFQFEQVYAALEKLISPPEEPRPQRENRRAALAPRPQKAAPGGRVYMKR